MTLTDIKNKKDKLQQLYDAVKSDLERRTDWQSFNGNNWTLRFVGIMNDGNIQAVVIWHEIGANGAEQYIGMSWENAFDAAKLNAI